MKTLLPFCIFSLSRTPWSLIENCSVKANPMHTYEQNAYIHTLVHSHRVPYECAIAKYTESMRVHIRTHLIPSPPTPILGQSVSKNFISGVTQLRNHMAVILNEVHQTCALEGGMLTTQPSRPYHTMCIVTQNSCYPQMYNKRVFAQDSKRTKCYDD